MKKNNSQYQSGIEVFNNRPLEDSFFIGQIATHNQIFYQNAFNESMSLRDKIYGKVDFITGKDKYDRHSVHFASIDGRDYRNIKIARYARIILNDGKNDNIGTQVEKSFNIFPEFEPNGRWGEMSRYVSNSFIEKPKKHNQFESFLYAISNQRKLKLAEKAIFFAKIADYGVENNFQGYAEVEDFLYKEITQIGVNPEIVSEKNVLTDFGNKENFVIKFDTLETRDKMHKMAEILLNKNIDLKDDFFSIGAPRQK